jgi:hypothetical protein
MVAPLVPLLALGGFGLWAHLAMKPPRRGAGQPVPPVFDPLASLPPPAPPPGYVGPVVSPMYPPAPVVAPVPSPAPYVPPAPVVVPLAPAPVPQSAPVVAVPVVQPPQQLLNDVHQVLVAPVPPPPAPVQPIQPVAAVPAAPPPMAPPSAPPPAPIVVPTSTLPASAPPPPLAATPAGVMPTSPAPTLPSVPALPAPEPTTTQAGQPPAGFNPVSAKSQAARVVANLKKGRDNYSRPTLSAWQRLAGIAADGIYGGASAGALAWYLQGTPDVAPRPFFKPTTVTPYRWAALAQAALAQPRA